MTELLSLSKASKMLGVTTTTIRVWDNAGKVRSVRSVGGHRRIPLDEVYRLQHRTLADDRTITVCYCRCSTQKQTENLERQVGRVLEHCSANGWKFELFKDIGSGLNDNRKQFKKLLKRVADPDVKRVVVEYKDRIARFGFETFVGYCANFGVEVLVLQDTEPKEFEQEFAEDIVALVASFSARLYGRRGGRKKKNPDAPCAL